MSAPRGPIEIWHENGEGQKPAGWYAENWEQTEGPFDTRDEAERAISGYEDDDSDDDDDGEGS